MKSARFDCSLIIPTRNRFETLAATLERITALPDGRLEVIVVDNGSTDGTPGLAERFNGVRWIELGENHGCAARNIGAVAARGWLLLMLDDDSWPEGGTVDRAVSLFSRRLDLGAAACRVRLVDPPRRHDAGGVPGAFFNCGAFIRRSAFLDAGGYPIDYEYYVEEYDLACRLWQGGYRVEPRGDLLVWHARVSRNRDNNRMLRLLVRNNLRLWRRYGPRGQVDELEEATLERYRRVAAVERAMDGFMAGVAEDRATFADRRFRRSPLTEAQFAELFGLSEARDVLQHWADNRDVRRAVVWSRGKGCEQLLKVLEDVRIRVDAIVDRVPNEGQWRGRALWPEEAFNPRGVDGIVVGSLSPGVAEDLVEQLRDRFPEYPVVSAAPWAGVERVVLAAGSA